MAALAPMHQPCQHSPRAFRLVTSPVISLPTNHVLLCSLCPCGRHRIFFTMHRNLLFAHTTRNNGVVHNVRAAAPAQRLEAQQPARGQRMIIQQPARVHRMEAQQPMLIERLAPCKEQGLQLDSDVEDVDR